MFINLELKLEKSDKIWTWPPVFLNLASIQEIQKVNLLTKYCCINLLEIRNLIPFLGTLDSLELNQTLAGFLPERSSWGKNNIRIENKIQGENLAL